MRREKMIGKLIVKAKSEENTVRENPRISLNELVKYVYAANPNKRANIIRQQKYPSEDEIFLYYRESQATIASFMKNDLDEEVVIEKIGELNELVGQSTSSRRKARLEKNILALEGFHGSFSSIDLKDCEFYIPGKSNSHIQMADVNISVQPEIILKKEGREAINTGAVKVYINASTALDEDMGKTNAALLLEQLKLNKVDGETPKPSMCCVIDVFAGNIFYATASNKKRLDNIQNACEEIAARWPSI